MKPVPSHRDAYGHQMWPFLTGGPSVEVVERDDGFVSVAPGNSYYVADVRQWTATERQAIQFARGGTALEVGCGAGRVALYLQRRGFRVTAIDNSPWVIKTTRARGVTDARVLPFEKIGQLPSGSLDAIAMFGNNFGLFGSRARARKLLKQLHRIARDRAVLLAQSLDPHKTTEPAHLRYGRRKQRRGRMPGQIRIRIRFNEWIGSWFDYLLVSSSEISAIVEGTGREGNRFLSDDGPRFVAVLRRV